MADEIDRAQALQEIHLNAQLEQRKPSPVRTGFCAWCDERVEPLAQFCDSDCRDDYEQSVRFKG